MQRFVSANAALFESAKWNSDVVFVVLIDMHRTGAQSACNAMGLVQITGPDPGLQAIYGLIGLTHNVSRICE